MPVMMSLWFVQLFSACFTCMFTFIDSASGSRFAPADCQPSYRIKDLAEIVIKVAAHDFC